MRTNPPDIDQLEEPLEVNMQDMLNVAISQRNSAMDEIVRQAAIIKALERRVRELSSPPTVGNSPPTPLKTVQ